MSLRQFIETLEEHQIQYLRQKMDEDPTRFMDLETIKTWVKPTTARPTTARPTTARPTTARQSRLTQLNPWDHAISYIFKLPNDDIKQSLLREMFEFLVFYKNMNDDSRILGLQHIINEMNMILQDNFQIQINMKLFDQLQNQLERSDYRHQWKAWLKDVIIPSMVTLKQAQNYIDKKMQSYGSKHRILQTTKNRLRQGDIQKTNTYLSRWMPYLTIKN